MLLGYEADEVDAGALRRALPPTSTPIVRSRAWHGVREEVGITYTYDYRVRSTDAAYEDRFFAELQRLSEPAPLTSFQEAYNEQEAAAITVADNHLIDAPSVERWLALNPPAGVDTARNTVFLVDWYDRDDFEHHVYTKLGEPDPDTGVDFGLRDSRKLVAWGGTTADDEETGSGSTRRVWFHDASAGPELFSGSWNVDDEDLDGDDVPDYRIPPVWEYAPGAYRSPAALTGDLTRLVCYVAVDLLFTASPIYPVDLPTRDGELARTIDIDSNTYEGWPGVDASTRFITQPLLLAELRELLWRKRLTYDSQDLPFTGRARSCYGGLLQDRTCCPGLGYPPFANLFLQNTAQLARTQDDPQVDDELPVFNDAVREPGRPGPGLRRRRLRDRHAVLVFDFVNPEVVASGYGLTTTIIHEVGHHVGLSHPHDGYDSASDVQFEPTGDFFFAWAGTESNSMMSYIDLNWDFSRFDLDNMDRFQTAEQVEAANRLAAAVLAAPGAAQGLADLAVADRRVGEAQTALDRHDYRAANTASSEASGAARQAAERAGVDLASALQAAQAPQSVAERSGEVHDGDEFIDTLEPDGPRSQP